MTLKQKILHLRTQNKSYQQIANELQCSKSTVCYHLNENQPAKYVKRNARRRKRNHPFQTKLEHYRTTQKKLYSFQNTDKSHNKKLLNLDDVFNKVGHSPNCYLTGDPININDPSSYQFDHMIPLCKGGDSTIDNLGITTKEANLCKRDLTPEEFLQLCLKVVKNHGYVVSSPHK